MRLLLPAPAQLTPEWRSLRSPHFEIASRYEPAKIEPLLHDLESRLNRPVRL